jgi:hypothetical protein
MAFKNDRRNNSCLSVLWKASLAGVLIELSTHQ